MSGKPCSGGLRKKILSFCPQKPLRIKHGVLLLLLASALTADPLFLERSFDAMGSTFSVALYGDDADRMQIAVDAVFEEIRRLDHLLSNYLASSEWSRVNREASAHPVKVSPELFRLLAACVQYSRASEGAFDITVGPLMKIWGFYKGDGRLPRKQEVEAALSRIGYQGIALDPEAQTVRLTKPGMEIDPGGIGKGYAVDRMVETFREYKIQSALLSAGGSSIFALGTPPGESGWKIRIRHPENPDIAIEEVRLRDQSMSTSGSYEKFFRAEGRTYSHIMDPRTGYPARGVASVSVIAPKTLDSEAWTKPFFVNGRQWAVKNKSGEFRVFFCEDKRGPSCAWLQ